MSGIPGLQPSIPLGVDGELPKLNSAEFSGVPDNSANSQRNR
jgi:hypothetical protein